MRKGGSPGRPRARHRSAPIMTVKATGAMPVFSRGAVVTGISHRVQRDDGHRRDHSPLDHGLDHGVRKRHARADGAELRGDGRLRQRAARAAPDKAQLWTTAVTEYGPGLGPSRAGKNAGTVRASCHDGRSARTQALDSWTFLTRHPPAPGPWTGWWRVATARSTNGSTSGDSNRRASRSPSVLSGSGDWKLEAPMEVTVIDDRGLTGFLAAATRENICSSL
jgi:hypothetical protein